VAHATSGENMAVDIFIKIGDIKGESQDKTHKDEIEVLNWSWGMSQSGNMHTGTGGGAGKVSIQDLSLTKYVDKATPNLMMHCSSGKHVPKVTLTVRKAGGDTQVEYLIINLEEVLISSLSTGGSGNDDRLIENITLNFAKVTVDYQPQKADGTKEGGPIKYGWNIRSNVKI
jgi:type VI secretion system secreted protein Hcp